MALHPYPNFTRALGGAIPINTAVWTGRGDLESGWMTPARRCRSAGGWAYFGPLRPVRAAIFPHIAAVASMTAGPNPISR
jgi:hypothetical protein